jgi:hypothetical protein
MKSSTAKLLAGGKKITKVVTWDSIGQADGDGTEILRSASVLREDTGLYHEDGLKDEDGCRLSEVLDTDMVLEIWTAEGKAWDSGVSTHWGALNTKTNDEGKLTWR